jgi:hypothetical protein
VYNTFGYILVEGFIQRQKFGVERDIYVGICWGVFGRVSLGEFLLEIAPDRFLMKMKVSDFYLLT